MLEFLTLLGQECGDAAAAALSAPGELGWALRQRTQDWGPGVAAGLHMLHTASCGGDGGTLDLSQPQQSQLTLAVLRCFGAWVRAGCLQHVDSHTAAYFASLAGQLLFAADSDRGLPYSPQHLPTAVDVTSEIIEHATDALQPLLLQLAAALPARVAALHAGSAAEAAGDVSHLYGLYVSTHTSLCAASGPQGAALRQVGSQAPGRLGGWWVIGSRVAGPPPPFCSSAVRDPVIRHLPPGPLYFKLCTQYPALLSCCLPSPPPPLAGPAPAGSAAGAGGL